jgi:hypothetical protein
MDTVLNPTEAYNAMICSKCLFLCICHNNANLQCFDHDTKIPYASLLLTPRSQINTVALYFVFWIFHRSQIILLCDFFDTWYTSFNIMHLRFITVVDSVSALSYHCQGVFHSWNHHTLFTIYLADIWVVSTVWLLWVIMLWMWLFMFCVDIYFISLGWRLTSGNSQLYAKLVSALIRELPMYFPKWLYKFTFPLPIYEFRFLFILKNCIISIFVSIEE